MLCLTLYCCGWVLNCQLPLNALSVVSTPGKTQNYYLPLFTKANTLAGSKQDDKGNPPCAKWWDFLRVLCSSAPLVPCPLLLLTAPVTCLVFFKYVGHLGQAVPLESKAGGTELLCSSSKYSDVLKKINAFASNLFGLSQHNYTGEYPFLWQDRVWNTNGMLIK